MITTWVLIMVMNVGGYGATSQKVENINSKAECIQMGKSFEDQLTRLEFSCVPFNSYEDTK